MPHAPKRRRSKLEYLAVADITPDPRNPRCHDRQQVRAIANSIEAFGFNAPILIDRTQRIIAGHGRFEAAKLAGHAQVPVIRLDHLSEAQARAYTIADNQLTDRSTWDDGVLAVHLKELSDLVLEFDIEATGFEMPEIDFRIQSLDPVEDADPADEFARIKGPAVSRPGDLWHLGDHRLLCGSALDAGAYATLLGGSVAAAVFTDPPYNVKVQGHVGGKGAIKHREFAMAAGEMTVGAFTAFLRTALTHTGTCLASGGVVFACMDWRHIGELTAAGHEVGFELLNLCVWVKSNGGMGSLYRSKHELVFVFRHGTERHHNNVQLGRFGRNRANVWNYPGANSLPHKGRANALAMHPTSKPIALVADAILDVTKPKDIVLDPFLGAGTTILAAERRDRRGYGIELDPLYLDTAITRWERLSKQQAVHASGLSLTDLRAQRSGL